MQAQQLGSAAQHDIQLAQAYCYICSVTKLAFLSTPLTNYSNWRRQPLLLARLLMLVPPLLAQTTTAATTANLPFWDMPTAACFQHLHDP